LSRITISAKIFSIAIGLVLIMAGVGTVTARMTRVIDNQLACSATITCRPWA
jgi:hypothetical protein